MQDDVLIGIDVGSTNIRCCAYDAAARLLASATLPSRRLEGAWTGTELLWDTVADVCRRTTDALGPQNTAQIRGVAVASVGCRAVVLDATGTEVPLPSGEPALFRHYRETLGEAGYAAVTGYPLEAGSIAFRLARLRETAPERFAVVGHILSVADYVNLRLTGVARREPSTAASMGLWDRRHGTWWPDLVRDLGLCEAILGTPQESGTFLGEVTPEAAARTGFLPGTPVFSGGHDYLCAALALGCIEPGSCMNITGTFDIVASFHAALPPAALSGATRTMSDQHVVPGLQSWMAESLSGPQVQWFARTLAGPDPSLEALFKAIAQLPPPFTATHEICSPHLFGQAFPRAAAASGAFVGIGPGTTTSTLFRALIEGLCFGTRRMVQQVAAQPAALPTAGGATRSPEWMQIKADVLGVPVAVPKIQEATALGAALLAGIGAGIYTGYQAVAEVVSRRGALLYMPRPQRTRVYQQVYDEVYLPLVDTATEMLHILEGIVAGEPVAP